MASVDNISFFETGVPHEEIVRAQLTSGTSTFVSRKFNRLHSVHFSVEGTNGATFTWTSRTVTIIGTNDDWVDLKIVGYD